MPSKPKIKIVDDTELRQEIEINTDLLSQIDLAKWAINLAFNNAMTKVTEEREWQLHKLNKYIKDGKSN